MTSISTEPAVVNSTYSFIDICAGTSERLKHWKQQAIQDGLTPDQIELSIAIDIEPKDNEVCKHDALTFLRSLPPNSVREINGDFFYLSNNSDRGDYDGSRLGHDALFAEISRVLRASGCLYITIPLDFSNETLQAAERYELYLTPIQFGYVGFLGGDNKLFPKAGLPAVEPVTHNIRTRQESVKDQEENNPLAAIFATRIGDYTYLGSNPVRYRAIKPNKDVPENGIEKIDHLLGK